MNYANITVDSLQNLGIYELRNLARQIGVYSPTQFKKDELIEKVMAIVRGEEQPYLKKSKQGRPAKQLAGFDEILNIFVPPVDQNIIYAKPFKSDSIFPSTLMQHMTLSPEDTLSFNGFVRLLKDYAIVLKNGFFEDNENTYYLTGQQVKTYGLRNGDFISGKHYVVSFDKPKLVKQIDFINGQTSESPTSITREDFEKLPAIYPNNLLRLSESPKTIFDLKIIEKICPFGEGSRVLINTEKDFNQEEFLAKLINALTRTSKLTLITTDERPEDLSYLDDACVDMELLNRNNTLAERAFGEQLINTFDFVLRQVEYGNNQILVIKNLDKLFRYFIKYYIIAEQKNEEEAKVFALEKVKSLLMLAKNTKQEKALTIIALNCSNDEISSLFTTNIKLNTLPMNDTDCHVDLFDSYTLKIEQLLSKDMNNKYLKFKTGLTKENVIEKLKEL